jgi:hypothetical protein
MVLMTAIGLWGMAAVADATHAMMQQPLAPRLMMAPVAAPAGSPAALRRHVERRM